MVKLVDLENKWALEIGKLFVAFGSIESLTYTSIKAFSTDPIYKHLIKMRLSSRIDVVVDLVSNKKLSEPNKREFIDNLKKVKKLAEKRNLIAHNPLVLQLFDNETGQDVFREIILSVKNERMHIEFDELMVVSQEAEKLSSSLHRNMAAFRNEGIIA